MDIASAAALRSDGASPGHVRSGSGSRWLERWSARLAHPSAVLIALPALVLVVGVVLTASTFLRVRAVGEEAAVHRFRERTRRAEASIQSAILQADALLDRAAALSRAHSSQASIEPFARELHDLALARRGLKWLSVSFPDGTFQGVFVERGKLRFQVSRIEAEKTKMQQYDFASGALTPNGTGDFDYDPRKRDFYRAAVSARRRLWTQPYPFFPDFHTGITRAEALFDGERLHAVVTADYDVAELSGVLGTEPHADSFTIVFSEDGSLLALAGLELSAARGARSRERALRLSDLEEPALSAFYAGRQQVHDGEPREYRAGEARYVAIEKPLRVPRDLGWRIAVVTDQSRLLAVARQHARTSLLSGALFVLASVVLASAFAIGIGRTRRARELAEQRASTAMQQVRELGSYQLEESIGAGGMGEVFRARHRMLARPAAIKLIRTEMLGERREAIEARFEREARVLSSLRSPNTVSVLDFGRTTDGRLFLVMELLDGQPLDRIVRERGPLPAARVLPILIGACRALAEAHAAGVVHRDVKPANLMLCYDGDGVERVKLIDFGLVKVPRSSELTAEGSVSGTPDYMAPEQAMSGEIDGRSDLYALGATAFHLLTGKPVFSEPSDVATLLAHQLKPPPLPSKLTNAYVPPELERLILRCLAKEPSSRPSSAASLARALSAITIPEEHRISPEALRDFWSAVSSRDGTTDSAVIEASTRTA